MIGATGFSGSGSNSPSFVGGSPIVGRQQEVEAARPPPCGVAGRVLLVLERREVLRRGQRRAPISASAQVAASTSSGDRPPCRSCGPSSRARRPRPAAQPADERSRCTPDRRAASGADSSTPWPSDSSSSPASSAAATHSGCVSNWPPGRPGADADAQLPGVGADLLEVGALGRRGDVRVARRGAVNRVEDRRGVANRTADDVLGDQPAVQSPNSGASVVRPREGFSPTRPQSLAGIRIDPPPSFAWAPAPSPRRRRPPSRRSSPRGARDVPRVAGRAVRLGLGRREDAELRRVGLAARSRSRRRRKRLTSSVSSVLGPAEVAQELHPLVERLARRSARSGP